MVGWLGLAWIVVVRTRGRTKLTLVGSRLLVVAIVALVCPTDWGRCTWMPAPYLVGRQETRTGDAHAWVCVWLSHGVGQPAEPQLFPASEVARPNIDVALNSRRSSQGEVAPVPKQGIRRQKPSFSRQPR